ncbi:MAG: OB-fold nucleic acid binding domain-containing protein, partial [Chloroflexota bacterium]
IDLSRIDYEDPEVYRALGEADTIGVFQVESAAQMQTIVRMRPQNLVDMAIEVALVRPGVGASDSTHMYVARRTGKESVAYDHPLVRRALERTLGAIVFQDQVNQLAIDVAGFSSWEADRLRRAFGRRDNRHLIDALWEKFRDGALSRGVPEEVARKIFLRFNGQYMFPESHAYAFGVTAYQSAWLKRYYPLEFYVGIFNQQPMGFYNLETLKEDARRHGVKVLNPDINLSREKCIIHEECLLLGFLLVAGVGEVAARRLVEERDRNGPYTSLADLMERTGLWMEVYDNLADAGAFDALGPDRRIIRWEVGLRYRPARVGKGAARSVASGLVPDETQQGYEERQLSLTLPVEQDMAPLHPQSLRERMEGEYRTLNLYPGGHLMAHLRPQLPLGVLSSEDVSRMEDGQRVQVAGLIIRRQRPHPHSGVVFLTLEDEFGHIPLIIWPQLYERYRAQFRFPVVLVTGIVSRRDGTMNVVVQRVEASSEVGYAPPSKNWC